MKTSIATISSARSHLVLALAFAMLFAALFSANARAIQPDSRPSQIVSDSFEPNNSASSPNFSIISPPPTCAAPQVLSNATISPVGDLDFFRFSPGATRQFTVTVRALAPLTTSVANDLALLIQLTDLNGNGLQTTSTTPGGSATLTTYNFVAGVTYHIRVQITGNVPNPEFKPYEISICQSDITISPTATSTTGPTPTVTLTPGSTLPDVFEVNDIPAYVLAPPNGGVVRSFLNVGNTFAASQLPNFLSTNPISNTLGFIRDAGDVDWYFFYGRNGGRYRITTTAQSGVDTELFIFRDSATIRSLAYNNTDTTGLIAANDDYQPLDRGSRVEFTGDYDGQYWVKVWNKDPSPRSGASSYNPAYNVAVQEIVATTVFTTITPTPFPQGIDRFEYNGDESTSALIAPNTKYDNLNFVPFQPTSRETVDNDWFRMPVKQGVYYTCETLDLAGGADTNLIVYNQNSPSNRDANAIGGNDNASELEKQRGNFASRVTWLSGYTGIVYLLIGDVTPPRATEGLGRTYSLQCTIGIPNTPTPTIDPRGTATTRPTFVPPTPAPPEPTGTPFPTPRAAQNLVVRPLEGGALAPPTRGPQPTVRLITLDVQVFIDTNRNGLSDAGEGVSNASVRLSDEGSGTPLSQAYTDADGRVRFQITNNTPVLIGIPLFGYSTVIDSNNAVVRLALAPSVELPDRLP